MNGKGFKSKIGFIFATIGSAVGLGNVWSFPFKLKSGGVLFVVFYILLAVIIGIPLLISEISIGRQSGASVTRAYKNISPKLSAVGVMSVISPCIIMSYYTAVGGCCINYCLINIKNIFINSGGYTNGENKALLSVTFSALFLVITILISYKGISKGIEKFNLFAVPLLIIILIISSIISLKTFGTLGDVLESIEPNNDFNFKKIVNIFSSAGEQMFFSLSIAVGTMITYGSYMDKKQDIPLSAIAVTFADTLVALLAGLTVLPASMFGEFNEQTLNGPELLFLSMQRLFSNSVSGSVLGSLFFLLIIIAAITSAVAFLEVPISVCDDIGIKNRGISLLICATLVFIPSAVISAEGINGIILSVFAFIAEGILIPFTALITVIYFGWFKGVEFILKENYNSRFYRILKPLFSYIFKFFAPLILLIVIIGQIISKV